MDSIIKHLPFSIEMNKSELSGQASFYVAIKGIKKKKASKTKMATNNEECKQRNWEQNSDDNREKEPFILDIMTLWKNRSLIDIKEEVSERFLGSDQDQVHISELGLAFERINPYNNDNQGICINTFGALNYMSYIK